MIKEAGRLRDATGERYGRKESYMERFANPAHTHTHTRLSVHLRPHGRDIVDHDVPPAQTPSSLFEDDPHRHEAPAVTLPVAHRPSSFSRWRLPWGVGYQTACIPHDQRENLGYSPLGTSQQAWRMERRTESTEAAERRFEIMQTDEIARDMSWMSRSAVMTAPTGAPRGSPRAVLVIPVHY